MAHAKYFGASSMHRRIDCPASATLEDHMPDSEGLAARTGSAAHALAEYCWETGEHTRMHVHTPAPHPYQDIIVTPEMCEAVQMYLTELTDIDADVKMIEQQVSYAEFVLDHAPAVASSMGEAAQQLVASTEFRDQIMNDCFGTADFVGINNTTNTIVTRDYKNGITPVWAEGNAQLRCYSLAVLDTFGWMLDAETVDAGIVQPHAGIRAPEHPLIDTETFSVADLKRWGKEVMIPAIIKALLPSPEYGATDHACQFCKAKGVCRARADKAQELALFEFDALEAKQPELPSPTTLSVEEMGRVLAWEGRMTKWFKDVRGYAAYQAIEEGMVIPGQKVVQGSKNLAWTDELAADKALGRAKISADERRKSWTLRTPTQISKEFGAQAKAALDKYATRGEGELKLVDESAKGVAITIKPKAKQLQDEFAEYADEVL
ncbi:MAG: hypothetical protein BWK73_25485 [Thiothrix lacustris]|uniref:DUF2800 domain-containing protein n=1 Tax=Thiothrix lacustris TaxID=525917 RepID=A0A1Y1QL74_9GAMM|nr:MAG: hypothetical protein BWK73_25485 [Thiothrix lacustris]